MTSSRSLCDRETGRVLVARLEQATSLWQRAVGLMGRRSLAADSGLWLEPCNAIHTFGMRFPVDVVFLDREGVVLRVIENLRPWRVVWTVRGARATLELPPGTLRAQSILPGMRLK
jgi:uncharacterized membrane protein (UPF0127 family)